MIKNKKKMEKKKIENDMIKKKHTHTTQHKLINEYKYKQKKK